MTNLADMLEKEWQQQVVQLATTLGWRCFHPYDSRKSERGWPDLSLCRERLLFLELKREKTHPTEKQREWIRALLNARAEIYVVRPRDLDALALILSCRGIPWRGRGPVVNASAHLLATTRKETSG